MKMLKSLLKKSSYWKAAEKLKVRTKKLMKCNAEISLNICTFLRNHESKLLFKISFLIL